MTQQRYRQIADALEREIAGLAPGARIESEFALGARFGVGRSAARAAVQELERRQLVRRIQGAGTFVGRRIDYVLSRERRPSWHHTIEAAGARARSVVLAHSTEPVDAAVGELLELPVGAHAHRMERLSHIDDLVASYGIEWVSSDAVPDLARGMRVEESLDEVLRQMGSVRAVRAWCRTASDIPGRVVQDHLQLVTAVPVWVVESVNRDVASGRPLTYSKAWMRGDAVRVVMEIDDPHSSDQPKGVDQ
ncbi:GntR family transcriptional regulator [Rhodococcus sp. HNM0569]|uniref:GntR family transcriptional regulator n=1 Tax=Rhodococcus sp. HNM0569 TaxID=2716340 RepID=UPI00146DF9DA|nr:GntR family transcriptional regulator [Rhodococcus sp. HNM0569]NLU84241.1 GntR family transcriptional regulator [Rhodococcus sp. HNM0569]